jgi:hypothetical protein
MFCPLSKLHNRDSSRLHELVSLYHTIVCCSPNARQLNRLVQAPSRQPTQSWACAGHWFQLADHWLQFCRLCLHCGVGCWVSSTPCHSQALTHAACSSVLTRQKHSMLWYPLGPGCPKHGCLMHGHSIVARAAMRGVYAQAVAAQNRSRAAEALIAEALIEHLAAGASGLHVHLQQSARHAAA